MTENFLISQPIQNGDLAFQEIYCRAGNYHLHKHSHYQSRATIVTSYQSYFSALNTHIENFFTQQKYIIRDGDSPS